MSIIKFLSLKFSHTIFITRIVKLVNKKFFDHELRLRDMKNYLESDFLFNIDDSHYFGSFNHKIIYAAHSHHLFHSSGYTQRTNALVSSIKKHGVNTSIFMRPGYPTDLGLSTPPFSRDEIQEKNLVYQFNSHTKYSIKSPESKYINHYAYMLLNYANKCNASIIHAASNYLNGSAAAIAAQKIAIPSIYEMRGLWHLTRAFYYPKYAGSDHFKYCEKREVDTCRGVDHVITLSDGLKNWLIERGIPETKISVVGNAAPKIDRSQNNLQQIDELRREYQLDVSRKIVGYLGSVVEYEGLDRLIRLLSCVRESDRPYLMIVGDGKARIKLMKQARKSGVKSDVIFTGRVSPDRVSAYYALFDVAALPRWDSELTRLVPPIKPFEIAAHGCPLLVSESVAQALGSTLTTGFKQVEFDNIADMNALISLASKVKTTPSEVPTWDDRGRAILSIYKSLN